MCDNTLLNVRLRDDTASKRLMRAPEPRPFRLDAEGGTLYCRSIPPFRVGDTRYFGVGNPCCGCGAWEHTSRAEGELRGRFLPIGFIRHFLGMEHVAFVEILWWWGGDGDQPRDPPCRWIAWSEFIRINDGGRLREGVLYRIADSRSELVRTWQIPERDRPSEPAPRPGRGATVERTRREQSDARRSQEPPRVIQTRR